MATPGSLLAPMHLPGHPARAHQQAVALPEAYIAAQEAALPALIQQPVEATRMLRFGDASAADGAQSSRN